MPEAHVSDLERDLALLLAVDPSPAFAAGVRERIAASTRSWARWWAAGAAAATVVLATTLAGRWAEPPATAPQQGIVAAHPKDVRLPASRPVAAVRPAAARRTPARAPRTANDPVVLVDAGQAEAVRRLLAEAARAPRSSPVALPVGSSPSEVSTIALNPMVVEPLSVPEPSSQNKGVQQ